MLAAGECRLTCSLWWTAPMLFRQAQPSVNAALATWTSLLVTHGACFSCLKYRLCYSWNCTVLHWGPCSLRKRGCENMDLLYTDTQTRVAVSQDKTKDPLWQFFWRVGLCRPKLFKNLCLSLVSGVPHFFLRLHPCLAYTGYRHKGGCSARITAVVMHICLVLSLSVLLANDGGVFRTFVPWTIGRGHLLPTSRWISHRCSVASLQLENDLHFLTTYSSY